MCIAVSAGLRFRVAVDADVDQYGPVPVHRRTAVPVAADAPPGRRAHHVDVADRARRVHARTVLVPRAGRSERHHQRVHAGFPQIRRVQTVHRVHRVRGAPVRRAAPVPVHILLPANIPQAEQDPPENRTLGHAPRQRSVAEQPVAARQRFHTAGTH